MSKVKVLPKELEFGNHGFCSIYEKKKVLERSLESQGPELRCCAPRQSRPQDVTGLGRHLPPVSFGKPTAAAPP